jgi:hypothetical protein
MQSIVANLAPAKGRQDHATSPSARNITRQLMWRVHRIPHPTLVTIAKRPSFRARDGAKCAADLGERSMPTGCGRLTRRAIRAWLACETDDTCVSRAHCGAERGCAEPGPTGIKQDDRRRLSSAPLSCCAASGARRTSPQSRALRGARDEPYSAAICRGAGGGLARSATSCAWRALASPAAFSFTGP